MKMKTIFKIARKCTEPKIGSQTQDTVGSHAPSPGMPGGGAVKQIGDRLTGDGRVLSRGRRLDLEAPYYYLSQPGGTLFFRASSLKSSIAFWAPSNSVFASATMLRSCSRDVITGRPFSST